MCGRIRRGSGWVNCLNSCGGVLWHIGSAGLGAARINFWADLDHPVFLYGHRFLAGVARKPSREVERTYGVRGSAHPECVVAVAVLRMATRPLGFHRDFRPLVRACRNDLVVLADSKSRCNAADSVSSLGVIRFASRIRGLEDQSRGALRECALRGARPYRNCIGDDTTPTILPNSQALLICGGQKAPLQNEDENFALLSRGVFVRRDLAPWK